MRKNHDAAFKAKVALEALKADRTIAGAVNGDFVVINALVSG